MKRDERLPDISAYKTRLPDISAYKTYLPTDHPMNEEAILTSTQAFALPVLMWLIDPDRNRATGRSTVVAHALIELAKRGRVVQLEDLSLTSTQQSNRHRQAFKEVVMRIAREHYPRDIFDVSLSENELRYVGRRP
jgi:hypothetical protein